MPPHKGIFFEIFCQIPLHRASNKQKGGRTWPRIWSSCTAATIRRCTATLCGSPAANTPPRSWRRRPFTGPWWPCRISGASAPPPPGCARSPGTPGPPCGGRRAGASPWTTPPPCRTAGTLPPPLRTRTWPCASTGCCTGAVPGGIPAAGAGGAVLPRHRQPV